MNEPIRDHAEEVALFRATLVGEFAHRQLDHGELRAELHALSRRRFRPPDSDVTRTYSVPTLERWLYAYRERGIDALRPRRRHDAGRARLLTPEQRGLLVAIRAEHRSASVPLILRTLAIEGVLPVGLVSAQSVRRLYRQAGLPRLTRYMLDPDTEEIRQRLRWQAPWICSLWHGDVCHALRLPGSDGKPVCALVHALLDDHSRFIVRLEVRATEREQDMLEVLANAVREHRAPDRLYLDNGATYSGNVLPIVCERLGIHLVHAHPGDAPARGKMERLWRTMREQCVDHLRDVHSLHDVYVRLLAWREQYHRTAHSSLMGRTPEGVWRDGTKTLDHQSREPVTEQQLRDAYVLRVRRRVGRDCTVNVDGTLYEIEAAWLAGRNVILERSCLADTEPCVVFEGRRFRLHLVDAVANSRRRRRRIPKARLVPDDASTVAFRPAETALRALLNPHKETDR